MVNSAPVSYTHLDVYKRQVQSNNGFVEISVTDEGMGFSKEALCHAQERFYMGDQSRNSKLHFGMGPVSYTHLDVYKRQQLTYQRQKK